jgi:hypothetical protein
MKKKALLSHVTRPGSCWLLLMIALLYVLMRAALLRRQYAGEFSWFVDYNMINFTIVIEAMMLHITCPGSC